MLPLITDKQLPPSIVLSTSSRAVSVVGSNSVVLPRKPNQGHSVSFAPFHVGTCAQRITAAFTKVDNRFPRFFCACIHTHTHTNGTLLQNSFLHVWYSGFVELCRLDLGVSFCLADTRW